MTNLQQKLQSQFCYRMTKTFATKTGTNDVISMQQVVIVICQSRKQIIQSSDWDALFDSELHEF